MNFNRIKKLEFSMLINPLIDEDFKNSDFFFKRLKSIEVIFNLSN